MSRQDMLEKMHFVHLLGGEIEMGTRYPTECSLEGHRRNETPIHVVEVAPFWICKFCVTNAEYERLSKRKVRPPSSLGDSHPVTEVTYLNAVSYAEWLSEKVGIKFELPTEAQWCFAAAPGGWQYPYQEDSKVERGRTAHFDPARPYGAVVVDDPLDVNHYGLHHMGGNVHQITQPSYYAAGQNGYFVDGAYCVTRGGDFGHCPLDASVHTRWIMDVSHRDTRVGFRLVCNEEVHR